MRYAGVRARLRYTLEQRARGVPKQDQGAPSPER
jgi:hypothetical protein